MTQDTPKVVLRLPGDLRERLKTHAKVNVRSANAEIVSRLEASFDKDKNEAERRCDNCRFHTKSGHYTICRRFPRPASDFLYVNDDAWCGEYRGEEVV